MSKGIFIKYPKLLNFYPPYLGAGIRIKSLSDTKNRFEVEMKLRWYNQNLFGTHFGGSLYAMCDPFYVFIVSLYFGKGYVVWDKSAGIEFKLSGKGKVNAIFEISLERLSEMKIIVDKEGTKTFHLETEVLDEQKQTIAKVTKEIYIRKIKD